MSDVCDFDLPWLAHHCDVFYIGGTKLGALCGEAVVFPRNNAPRHFFNIVKQHGALLAKSRLAGIQFEALFTDDLYFRIARHAIDMAMQMRQLFINAGLTIKDSPSNQQFVVLSKSQIQHLRKTIDFETWEPVDSNLTLCRFVTSWATKETDIAELRRALQSIPKA
jgi:threonine aldolase